MFVDKVQVTVKAGDGGDGAVSFRRDKFISRGGPDGGDGGHGGDIIFVASRNQNTLAAFRYKKELKADNGKSGSKRRKHGRSGRDLEVQVPVGTVVINENREALADLTHDEQKATVAIGGRGGYGNAHFVSSTRQAPRVAEKGENGEEASLILELKMIADVGLVGLPNAGKSTLLSVVSNARPEIADYPFTTLTPNLGVVDIDKKDSLLFADIPGLIEGASQGKGLGDEFLRHIERTEILVHLIDIYQNDIVEAYKTIQHELKAYEVDLSVKPQIIVLTKIDGLDDDIVKEKQLELAQHLPKHTPIFAVSSKSGKGIKELLFSVLKKITTARDKRSKLKGKVDGELPVLTLPDEYGWHVVKTENGFRVSGKKIEQFAKRTDFKNYHGVNRLRDIMRKTGIIRELKRQGIEPDQTIQIGNDEKQSIKY